MINLVVALPAEAKALRGWYGLQSLAPVAGFPCFGNETLRLVVCGPGKVNAGCAVTALHCCQMAAGSQGPALWLNLGIAGARRHSLGDLLQAIRIVDGDTGERWYPQLTVHCSLPRATVVTVARPVSDYPGTAAGEGLEDPVVEMEAAGFVQSALRFATAEWVHCLKVISDNPDHGHEQINARRVTDLLTQAMPAVDDFVGALRQALAQETAAADQVLPGVLERWLARWHFTISERQQLQERLRHLAALGAQLPDPANLDCDTGAQVLARLAVLQRRHAAGWRYGKAGS